MMNYLFEKESYAIRGALFEVYKEKGSGFLEDVYQECLELELSDQRIPFIAQAPLNLTYKGRSLAKKYKPDFLCHGEIILEIKAVKQLEDIHRAQVLNYLKATDKQLGFLVNFKSHPQVTIERIINSKISS
jgi:GxxExxY protein